MEYFLETVETVPSGLGFSHYSLTHLIWLALGVAFATICCVLYRNGSDTRRNKLKKLLAALVVADELFKMAGLTLGGNYTVDYLPLHLCSINIILIAIHVFKPTQLLDNFLYVVCIPGAVAALLFPTWTSLPVLNFMHLHSFTVHILLAVYPLMLTVGGDIRPKLKVMPKLLFMLVAMSIPIYGVNLLLDTNYMFLMYADPGNPLYLFEQMWGNHLYGFPVLITAVLVVMYTPIVLLRKKAVKTP